MEDRPITDGARALRAFLDLAPKPKSVPDFCQEHGLDRLQVQKALNGTTHRISVDLATSIERATGGVVQASAWRTDTVRLSPVGRRPRARRSGDSEAAEPSSAPDHDGFAAGT